MRKQYINRKGELAYLDDGEIMPDGGTLRTPIHLMDAMQQEIAAASTTTKARITDSAGRPAGSRPGYCLDATDTGETQARAAYDKMCARAQSTWRGPNATLISDATTPEASRDAYIKRTEQSWQARDAYGGHVSIPGGDDDNDVELARKKYIDGLSNAWRTCKGVGFGA